jgi:integrase
VKFPKVIRNQKTKVEVTIYGKSKGGKPKKDGGVTQPYPFYRVCWRVAGQRRMESFTTYSEALTAAEKLVGDLGRGSQVTALTPRQATDALAAYEWLQAFYQATGLRVSLLTAVSGYAEAARKLQGRSLDEAVDGFLNAVVQIKVKNLCEATEQFIESRKRRTIAREGRRPALSPEHHYLTSRWLLKFAGTFRGLPVSDLTKEQLNQYMAAYSGAAPKTRNEHRAVIKMLLRWCVEQDFLAPNHRLFEASDLKHENADPEEIDFYRPTEFQRILDRAIQDPPPTKEDEEPIADYRELVPALALAGLAGMRIKEIMRLTWEDIFGIPGHIEVKAMKSKTRSRRLIQISPALAGCLEPYRGQSGPVWLKSYDMFHIGFGALRNELKIPDRRNGMRHSFCTFHFALHSNENLTAAEAGNSPQQIHAHYKGLATRAEGEKWFDVRPAKVAGNVVPFPVQVGA